MTDAATIYALASAPGRAGVALVRVSGPRAGDALSALAGSLPAPRMAAVRTLRQADLEIDQALVLWFPGPHSFTGENVAEFHIHGGRAVRESLFAALESLGARPARPGEFSRRAVEHGRLDLTRAEAIADLVEAETPAQLAQALRQYDGALASLYEGWRGRLVAGLAHAEAAIDFSDDGVGGEEFATARAAVTQIIAEIQAHLEDGRRGEALREGLRIAIIGPPNAGKSSLINALAQREAAIVSDIAGTTRDVIELRLNLGGYLVHVADTAGLREADDAIEAEGVRRALAKARESDLVLLLVDGTAPYTDQFPAKPDLVISNKSDLPGFQKRDGLALSLKSGEGLSRLIETLSAMVAERLETKGETPALTRPRHREALGEALASLRHGLDAPADQPELFAEDLRLALRAVGRILGRVDVEELLDVVFRDFCIGK
ncbi:MAG TPA: tRNA uridine-5-carboxymethylaminomethyl(34) synthesis GTPase MnmE [Rhizomicrobium sp.]|nr:tRNA uridine-5-carboxymethylaminomethyl(34) synthesis GTPase MnmE [Rhizomicrobium sp.]